MDSRHLWRNTLDDNVISVRNFHTSHDEQTSKQKDYRKFDELDFCDFLKTDMQKAAGKVCKGAILYCASLDCYVQIKK